MHTYTKRVADLVPGDEIIYDRKRPEETRHPFGIGVVAVLSFLGRR